MSAPMSFKNEHVRSTVAWLAILAAGIAGMFSVGGARAEGFTDDQKVEIGEVIREYLLSHPQLLQDALVDLQQRQKIAEDAKRERVISQNSAQIFSSPEDVVLGNPQGRVTLVEFFDYNCGYCKKSLDDIARLIRAEPDLKFVLKDFPVLGPGSVEAATIAAAVSNQFKGERFWQFHQKLLGGQHGPVGETQALSVAREMGANMRQLADDAQALKIKSNLQSTIQLAEALTLTGTPSFVLGSDVVIGAVGYDELKNRVDGILKCGKAVCS